MWFQEISRYKNWASENNEEYNAGNNELIIKTRKGNKAIESLADDIYSLSIFYLEKQFSENIDEIFTRHSR